MASVTSLGIGSGIDLEGLVTAFIDAEAIPTEIRLQEKEERLTLELSGIGSFKSALSTFNSTLEKLAKDDAFNQQTVSVSTEDVAVTTNGFASNGEFAVEVFQIAQGSRQKSASFTSSADTVGSGTLTFTAGANTFDVAIDGADDLSAIRDKINEQSGNFGVTANIINSDAGSYLIYTSSITGLANNLTVTNSDASLDNISTNNTVEQSATNAIIEVDGNRVIKDTNEFKNLIEDVTITAKKVNVGAPATLTIAQDEANGRELIDEFVNGFNALMDNITGLGAPKLGRLAFDPNVRQVKQQLTDIVINSVTGLTGDLESLSDIGIELNKEGKLEVSSFSTTSLPSGEERLTAALKNNLDQVGEIFASTDGIATQMTAFIDTYTDSDGVLTLRESSLNEQISGISQEWEDLEQRLRSYEETLRKRFTALDATIAQYNATGDYVKSSLANIIGNNDD
ncbi:flagellar filament capping protein FliD [Litorilituus sediminis]|uniref:Flagellar hook-associated protein 2 n=1 Tax=Litorilituus sediminis TaxID=718192 RepID=A0A4P6P764_9GAMM|nr:flagellar filament capping protein FliD [Litorilituus sediminis]QBG35227.1 flagellar capping protein [Litorilituus sediminis]